MADNKEFFEAIKRGDIGLVERLIAGEPKLVHARTDWGGCSLHLAAEIGQPELINLLLMHHANPNALDDDGQTPLFYGVLNPNYREIVSLLLDYNADVNALDSRGQNILHELVLDGTNEAQVQFLVGMGANINQKSKTGATPLHLAAMQGMETSVRSLVESGAEVNSWDINGETPLHFAVYGNIMRHHLKFHILTTENLILLGADISAKSNDGYTPLDFARRHFGYPELSNTNSVRGLRVNRLNEKTNC